MRTREINALLALINITPIDIARGIERDRAAVSQTINYLRPNQRLRKEIAKYVAGIVEQKLFDDSARLLPGKTHNDASINTLSPESITRETTRQ